MTGDNTETYCRHCFENPSYLDGIINSMHILTLSLKIQTQMQVNLPI
jgi:hypothetical protein